MIQIENEIYNCTSVQFECFTKKKFEYCKLNWIYVSFHKRTRTNYFQKYSNYPQTYSSRYSLTTYSSKNLLLIRFSICNVRLKISTFYNEMFETSAMFEKWPNLRLPKHSTIYNMFYVSSQFDF